MAAGSKCGKRSEGKRSLSQALNTPPPPPPPRSAAAATCSDWMKCFFFCSPHFWDKRTKAAAEGGTLNLRNARADRQWKKRAPARKTRFLRIRGHSGGIGSECLLPFPLARRIPPLPSSQRAFSASVSKRILPHKNNPRKDENSSAVAPQKPSKVVQSPFGADFVDVTRGGRE